MSTKTIAQKLLIKPKTAAWVSDPAQQALLEPLPEGATFAATLAEADVAVLLVQDAASAKAALADHSEQLAKAAILWVAYPKGNRTDINRDTLWPLLSEHGMRPNGQVAIDDTWSALRFRALAEGEVFNPAAARA